MLTRGKDRALLMVAAAVVVLATFRVGVLAPPRGFWRQDKAGHHQAGTPVMLTLFPASYAWFTRFTTMTMLTSGIIILLLSSECFYRTWTRRTMLKLIAFFDGAFFLGAFLFGSWPEDPLRGLTYLVAGFVVSVMIYSLVLFLVYIAINLPWRNQNCEALQAAAETVMDRLSHASSSAGASCGAVSQMHPSIP